MQERINQLSQSAEDKAEYYRERAFTHDRNNNLTSALRDYTAALEVPNLELNTKKVNLYLERAAIHVRRGDYTSAIQDYTAALEAPNSPPHVKVGFYRDRAETHARNKDYTSALQDYTAAIEFPNASLGQTADCYRSRASIHMIRGNHESALQDYTAAIETPDLSASTKTDCYRSRASIHMIRGDHTSALQDYTAANSQREAKALKLYDVVEAAQHSKRPDRELSAYLEILSVFLNDIKAVSGAVRLLTSTDQIEKYQKATDILQKINNASSLHTEERKGQYIDMIERVSGRLQREDITSEQGIAHHKEALKLYEAAMKLLPNEEHLTACANAIAAALQDRAEVLSREGLEYANESSGNYHLDTAITQLKTSQDIWKETSSYNSSLANGSITLLEEDLNEINSKKQRIEREKLAKVRREQEEARQIEREKQEKVRREQEEARQIEEEKKARIEQSKNDCITTIIYSTMENGGGKFSATTEGAAISNEVKDALYNALNSNWESIGTAPDTFARNTNVHELIRPMIKQESKGSAACGDNRAGGEVVFRKTAGNVEAITTNLSEAFASITQNVASTKLAHTSEKEEHGNSAVAASQAQEVNSMMQSTVPFASALSAPVSVLENDSSQLQGVHIGTQHNSSNQQLATATAIPITTEQWPSVPTTYVNRLEEEEQKTSEERKTTGAMMLG